MVNTSHLYSEIYEQPAVIGRLLAGGRAEVGRLAEALRDRGISHVIIAARGTSDNAARYAQYLLGAINGMLVTLATPSLFSIYQRPPRIGDALVLGISQSGQSPDVVGVLLEARRQGALTAAITNDPASPLARAADHVIATGAGHERAVAATKTYTSQLAALALLSALLAEDVAMLTALAAAPQLMEQALSAAGDVERAVQRYRYMQRCIVIGRGFNYATAFELALKLKELTYTIVEPYSSADFLHGPIALVEHGFPVIVVAPSGIMLPDLREFTATLRERSAELIVISDDRALLSQAHTPLALPAEVPEWLAPLVAILPGQLFAMHLASTRGYDIDQPRGIRKVTETR